MPTCAKCNKRTFDGTRWTSATTHREFNGKYLCRSCYQVIEKEQAQFVYSQNPQLQQKNKEILDTEIANCRARISNLASLYADGKISENSYITTSKVLEDKLKSLESMREKNAFSDFSTFSSGPNANQVTQSPVSTKKPSSIWYMAPVFFALLGGIIGYVVVKDDDRNMANNLLMVGVLMTIVNTFIIWGIYSWALSQAMSHLYYYP